VSEGRARRAIGVGALLLVAALIVAIQFSRLGGPAPPTLPPDAPPGGVDLFYVRDPGNAHGLIAFDWNGQRRGSLKLPTWVEISRLRQAPDGSGFLLDPGTPGDYAAYFDRAGRVLFETDDQTFVSQVWADDSAHVCVVAQYGNRLLTRVPGQPDHEVQAGLGGELTLEACSLRTDTVIAGSQSELDVLRLSTGRLVRSVPTTGTAVASTDAAYVAVPADGAAPVSIYKVSDMSKPVAQVVGDLQPLAFSGDDSLLLTALGDNGVVRAIAWRTGKVAWTEASPRATLGFVLPRPSDAEFLLYLSTGAALVRADGTRETFG
jgi:hypothetical protein